MSSDLKVTNIKHESSSSNNLVLGSDGNVSITNTLSAGTIGDNVVFPAGHIVQSVMSPNISDASTSTTFTSEGVAAKLDGQITITSGNGVLIYFLVEIHIDRGANDVGSIARIREGLTTGGNLLVTKRNRLGSAGDVQHAQELWCFDSSPASTTPDYCLTLERMTTDTNLVKINNTGSDKLQAFLFEVKQ